jgi:hypothetical protein
MKAEPKSFYFNQPEGKKNGLKKEEKGSQGSRKL